MRETPILELLGPPQLRTPDGVSVELRQKAFALAALLHVEFRGRARRQAVADRLWETATGSQASTNLRQVLLNTRVLEARHGFELFEADQTWIALSPSINVDLVEIGRIRTVNELAEFERLMHLYRGGLLEGLTGSAEGLSLWIETERTRIEDQFVAQAAGAALRVGGRVADAALARLAEIQPYADDVCQAQMRLLRQSGDEIGVRTVYNGFRTRLWKTLQAEPDAETEALLVPPPVIPATAARQHLLREGQVFGYLEHARVPRIVLLPPLQEFSRSGTPKHIAPALIEDVTISLCRLRSLTVIAPHTAWQFDPFSALDEIRSHQIDYAVESRVAVDHSSEDGTLGLAVRLIRASGREIVWTDKFKFTVADAPERYRDLVNGIAGSLADRVEAAELAAERTNRDPTAYSHYLAGREDMRSFDLPRVRKARKSFRFSTELAPELAMAESSLARSYVVEWVLRAGADNALLDKAKLHAERAVHLDPLDGNGYRELGRAALFVGDLEESLRQFSQAERFSPNHADVLADYADTLAHNSDFVRARERIEAALLLNPMPPDEYWWTLGGIEFFQGRFEEAVTILSRMKNQEPGFRLLAASAAMAGDASLARQYRLRSLAYQPDFTIAGWVRRMPMRNAVDVDLYIEGLRRAGFK
jgi:DNA-binding SARP family transcriptional activator/TolB-like protein